MVQRVDAVPLSQVIANLSNVSVTNDRPIVSLYLHSHGHDLESRKQVRVFFDRFLRSEEIERLVNRDAEWEQRIRAIEKEADAFLNGKEKAH